MTSVTPHKEHAEQVDHAAVAVLRAHVKKHFAGPVALVDLPGYYALVHAAWRLTQTHPQYPPEGCWWRRVFWGTGGNPNE